MNRLLIGILYGIMGQILTFLQLQGNIKYGWFHKYPIIVLIGSIPISFMFIKSVENLVKAYDGELWPSRLIGFGIGAIVFTILSWLLFKEPFTLKTGICMLLASAILIIQIIWK
jgi:multidrug transporter EmrE-like cation transporter